jgi:hypothetical protein
MSAARVFWLTLFAIGAVAALALGWSEAQPWTAAAFVVFFTSRVARSIVKARLTRRRRDNVVRRTNQFIVVTAAGWIGAGACALVAAWAGEGLEWLFVAPVLLVMGALNVYVLVK